jgi:GT2 family glycosyltransferase
MTAVDVLVPTRDRPAELATTLAGLAAQTGPEFRVVISDQSDSPMGHAALAMVRVLRHRGVPVQILHNLPRQGMAQQRDFLFRHARAPFVMFLDDDVWLEPGALRRLLTAIETLRCGLVGYAVQGLSYLDDVRPHELQPYEEWPGRPEPERISRDSAAWGRWTLHNAANPTHLASRLRLRPGEWRAYKVAWIGGCVLFDRDALASVGGFAFWPELPVEHAGEDVVAQQRVMQRFGGAGILPSGAVHLESPTTIRDRRVEASEVLSCG